MRVCAQRHPELLPEEQVLHHQRTAPPERTAPDPDNKRQPFPHGLMVAHSTIECADGLFAPYRSWTAAFRDCLWLA